ncbi:MAG: hypothetical protein JWQ89_3624 [Devosia sp.]|uniref:hypothetical protein n=1 Tax=Devosia sp. TaxID=1871048 RepID=UPI0026184447|nr:hypothetical protein [Devosia sp.]MDB5541897.1 hypothetical protein [Devosia sp.]
MTAKKRAGGQPPSNDGKKSASDTRFKQGNAGGPGRRAGSRNKATLLLDKLADDDAADVLRKQIDLAKNGDQRAAELVLSRVWPTRKGRPVALDLPLLTTPADIVAALGIVAASMADGSITPEEANAAAGVLEIKRKAVETVDLEARIAALEQERK